MLFFYSLEFSHFVKSCLFISFCILRDLCQQKIPRELCGGVDPLYFYFLMERFFAGTDQEKFKNTRKKGKDQENSKKQWRKEKQEIFTFVEVLILMCSVLVRHQGLPPSRNPPSGEPTHMGTSLQL
jgi:hypothetical protein